MPDNTSNDANAINPEEVTNVYQQQEASSAAVKMPIEAADAGNPAETTKAVGKDDDEKDDLDLEIPKCLKQIEDNEDFNGGAKKPGEKKRPSMAMQINEEPEPEN